MDSESNKELEFDIRYEKFLSSYDKLIKSSSRREVESNINECFQHKNFLINALNRLKGNFYYKEYLINTLNNKCPKFVKYTDFLWYLDYFYNKNNLQIFKNNYVISKKLRDPQKYNKELKDSYRRNFMNTIYQYFPTLE